MSAAQITEIITPVIDKMGMELVGVEYRREQTRAFVCVYIDRGDGGVTIDDCASVSEQVGALLDVHDLVHVSYELQVSSPGIERPLFTVEQCTKYIDRMVSIVLSRLYEGRRRLTGRLRAVNQEAQEITVQLFEKRQNKEGKTIEDVQDVFTVPWSCIRRARLVWEDPLIKSAGKKTARKRR